MKKSTNKKEQHCDVALRMKNLKKLLNQNFSDNEINIKVGYKY